MEELIARLFQTQKMSTLDHWKTGSYAQHKTLNMFYDELQEIMDEIVETSQYVLGDIKDLPELPKDMSSVMQRLDDDFNYIIENQPMFSQGYRMIDNIIDGLVGLYSKTLNALNKYK